MTTDLLTLSRAQFALTIMFHYLFPPLSIGLGTLMVLMEGAYLVTKDRRYSWMARFWTRIFAVNFAMGVATGLVMEFEFGTNWSTYSRYVGDIFGSALAAEGMFAFFLESGFLAVLVFGWDRVGPKTHFFATSMVALGSIFSSVWIVIANSWQQTPAGYVIEGTGLAARARITDFWAMVFNPSAMPRLAHVLIGAWLLGAFFVASVCAYYLLKGRHIDFAQRGFKLALGMATVMACLAPAAGHVQADLLATTQPAKLAALEGHFKTGSKGAKLYLFGLPDPEKEEVVGGVGVPGGLSFLLHGDPNHKVKGLNEFRPEDRPPVRVTFAAYHIMVAMGGFFLALVAVTWLQLWRKRLWESRWLLWTWVFAVVTPFIANQAGWVAAEVGRQPWVVYGLLRTSDALSKRVAASHVLGSIIMFALIYILLFLVWVFVLHTKITHGPDEPDVDPHSVPAPLPTGGLLDAAGALSAKSGPSLTECRDDEPGEEAEG